MFDAIFGMWEWYIAGPLLGLFVPLLLLINNKQLGISSSFLQFCALFLPAKSRGILQFDRQKDRWKFYFAVGIMLGGFIAATFLTAEKVSFLPQRYYDFPGMLLLFGGGILIGFGTRYANGCTSGHSIMGLSLLHWPSLKATLAFFAGGLFYTYLILFI